MYTNTCLNNKLDSTQHFYVQKLPAKLYYFKQDLKIMTTLCVNTINLSRKLFITKSEKI